MTGVVHWFLLRPLLDLEGWSYVTDKLLHVAVPLLAIVGWCVFGPRPRIERDVVVRALAWPLAYVAYTLVTGAITDWYPYPFVDVGLHGCPTVALNGVGVLALFLLASVLLRALDRRRGAAPVPRTSGSPAVSGPARCARRNGPGRRRACPPHRC